MEAFLDLVPREDRESLSMPGAGARLERLVASGPVPPALLLKYARETGFPGTPLLERAVASSPGGGDLFVEKRPERDEQAPATRPRGAAPAEPDAGSLRALLESIVTSAQETLGERRDGQAEMARAVMTALLQGEISFVEAGTGTGKSIAYLIPAALFSAETGERVIVSRRWPLTWGVTCCAPAPSNSKGRALRVRR